MSFVSQNVCTAPYTSENINRFKPEPEPERCHTKNRKLTLKQHIKYRIFNFRSKVQLDHSVINHASSILKGKLHSELVLNIFVLLRREMPKCGSVEM